MEDARSEAGSFASNPARSTPFHIHVVDHGMLQTESSGQRNCRIVAQLFQIISNVVKSRPYVDMSVILTKATAPKKTAELSTSASRSL